MKLALVFPGQGSQYIGMGLKWLSKYPFIKEYFDRADEALGFSISKLCFEGPETELVKTANTQPAILTCSVAMFEILKKEHDLDISYVAGHSLGEYSALCASGALNFEDAVKIVNLRGQLMQEAVPFGLGKMLAVRKCSKENLLNEISIVREHFNDDEAISVANYNSDSQIVVSGKSEAVTYLENNLSNKKIKSIALNVSAPFHSSLMKKIVPKFSESLSSINISPLKIPYLANIDAKVYTSSQSIKENLLKQIPGSVLWTQTISELTKLGVNRTVEVGPGKVLSKLSSSISGATECLAMDSLDNLENIF